jgi:hypothetical protein
MARDRRFVAVHRGGSLDVARHRLLARWAAACAVHVLPLFVHRHPDDDRPRRAIEAARLVPRQDHGGCGTGGPYGVKNPSEAFQSYAARR